MIDLEKEREGFERVFLAYRPHLNFYLQTWEEKSNSYACMTIQWYFDVWKKRAELAHQEISELKAKLAKYESKDVVVVPRVPTKEMLDAGFLCGYGSSTREPYKAMIEVGEIK